MHNPTPNSTADSNSRWDDQNLNFMVVSPDPPATPFEFTVIIPRAMELTLNEIVWCECDTGYGRVCHWGIVESLQYSHRFTARVKVLRINPEFWLPPYPGSRVASANYSSQAEPGFQPGNPADWVRFMQD